jgi:hypothetical protein
MEAGQLSLEGCTQGAVRAGAPLKVDAERDHGSWRYLITNSEVELCVPLPDGTAKTDVVVELKATHISIGLRGQKPIVCGALNERIDPDESFWQLEGSAGQRSVAATLQKQKAAQRWEALLLDEVALR